MLFAVFVGHTIIHYFLDLPLDIILANEKLEDLEFQFFLSEEADTFYEAVLLGVLDISILNNHRWLVDYGFHVLQQGQ